MVASSHRISRRSDFTRTLKSGVRVNTRDLVIHLLALSVDPDASDTRRVEVATSGGPWLGLIVSKSVGDAVTRHAVARRLRAAFRQCLAQFPSTEVLVVIRARREASSASSVELADQLSEALTHKRFRRSLPNRELGDPGTAGISELQVAP